LRNESQVKDISYTKWDHRTNEDILDKLKIKPLIDYIKNYRIKGKEHVNRMKTGKIQKQILHYHPQGQRLIRCPMKRWEGDHNRPSGLIQQNQPLNLFVGP
jgi:hypothetical protein